MTFSCKKRTVLVGATVIFLIYSITYLIVVDDEVTCVKDHATEKEIPLYFSSQDQKPKYLINTTNCHIPDVDPFNNEVKEFFRKEQYTKCANLDLLTYISKDNGVATLQVNTSLLPQYSSFGIRCCYSEIRRVQGSDEKVKYSSCVPFEEKVIISYPFIRIVCRNTFFKTVYKNVHSTAILTEAQQKLPAKNDSIFSILMVGIDSISKQNLRRTMPETYNFLEKNFISLKGYNKIGDNTFPNLMAILSGQNETQLERTCPDTHSVNECEFIWNTFKDLGYTTAYAEDECFLSTFNFARPGFSDPPTDFFYRPYILAAEDLPTIKSECHNHFCAGPEASGERILNSARDFSITFKNLPVFGLFWMNSFSHDNINCPSAMDGRILQFLSDPDFISSLDNTILIFFSDHGYRFGDIRYTNTGWLEERLPFIYFYVPDSFKKKFPREYANLVINSQRLTTPYDIHNTLQHVIQLNHEEYEAEKSIGCTSCHSLLEEVSETRSCEDANIAQHWCTCQSYDYVNPRDPAVINAAQFAVENINSIVKRFPESAFCVNYSLANVHSAGVSQAYLSDKNDNVNYYLVKIKTAPIAMFEATVEMSSKFEDMKLAGDISRINRYADNSHCISDRLLKKYCYCNDFVSSLKNKLCDIFDIC